MGMYVYVYALVSLKGKLSSQTVGYLLTIGVVQCWVLHVKERRSVTTTRLIHASQVLVVRFLVSSHSIIFCQRKFCVFIFVGRD